MNSQRDDLTSLPLSVHAVGSHTRINITEEAEAEGEIAAVYQYFRDKMGRRNVPGLLKCFSTNPTAARLMVDMGAAILFHDGFLSRRQKEMIATYVSSMNRCPYCLDSHGYFLTLQGVSSETTNDLATCRLDEAGISLEERELLRFAGRVDSESSQIVNDDVERLRAFGWKEEQVAEAVHVSAMMALCNRVANTFGLTSQGLMGMKLTKLD